MELLWLLLVNFLPFLERSFVGSQGRQNNGAKTQQAKRLYFNGRTFIQYSVAIFVPGVGGTPLYKPYRYVPPQRVGFLRRFGIWKLGLDFAHFNLEPSMVYEGTTFVYQFVRRFSS